MTKRGRENDGLGPAGGGLVLPRPGRFANRPYSEVRCWDAQSGLGGRPVCSLLGKSPSATSFTLGPRWGA